MKIFSKIIIKLLITFSVFGTVSFKRVNDSSRLNYKQSSFVINGIAESLIRFKTMKKNGYKIEALNSPSKKMIDQCNSNCTETNVFSRIKSFSRQILFEIPNLAYFKEELLYNIGNYQNDVNENNDPETFHPIGEIIPETSGQSAFIDINVDEAFNYAKSVLLQENVENIDTFIDSLEFREYCINKNGYLDGIDCLSDESELCGQDMCLYYERTIGKINSFSGRSFLKDPSDNCGGSDEEENSNELLNQDTLNLLPSEIISVEQLNYFFSPHAVDCICVSLGSAGAGCGAFCIPVWGKLAAIICFTVAIIILLTVINEVINFIEYVIGFFVNCLRKFVDLIASFFASLFLEVESNALDIAIDGCENELQSSGIDQEYAKNIIKSSIFLDSIVIDLDNMDNDLIVALGVFEKYKQIAEENGFVYFRIDDITQNEIIGTYAKEGFWVINQIFLSFVILKGAKFALCSRPSLYYDKFTKTILTDRIYARELHFINAINFYEWLEIPPIVGQEDNFNYIIAERRA